MAQGSGRGDENFLDREGILQRTPAEHSFSRGRWTAADTPRDGTPSGPGRSGPPDRFAAVRAVDDCDTTASGPGRPEAAAGVAVHGGAGPNRRGRP
jgi:hypothetical protein